MRNLFTFLLLVLAHLTLSAKLIYVAHDATGLDDGTSWANAYTNFQEALDATTWNETDTVWVKEGTYRPDRPAYGNPGQGNARQWVFFCPKPVWIYGGFAGTESRLNQRDWYNHPTILDGDIGTVGDNSDNVYRVVFLGNGNYTTFDGFTIQHGNANNNSNKDGAGLALSGMSTATLRNLIIRDCEAMGNGAGLYAGSISAGELTDIYTYDNVAEGNGGGFYFANFSDITLANLFAYRNKAEYGGGMYTFSFSSMNMEGVVLCGNEATLDGGGIILQSHSDVNLVNCSMTHNEAGRDGGGLWGTAFSKLNLTNSTCYNNTATGDYGGLYVKESSDIGIYNSIFWDNEDQNGQTHRKSQAFKGIGISNMTIRHSILEGSNGSGGSWDSNIRDRGNNMDSDPFISAGAGPDASPCTLDDNYAPTGNSVAIDAGSNSAPGLTLVDPSGNPRVAGNGVDIGAFESQPSFPVEWLFFEGEYQEGSVALTWETASEQNSQSFLVQRLADGSEEWQNIGELEAQGNKVGVTTYGFVDLGLPLAHKLTYRLKQIDLDGNYGYSSLVEVFLGENGPMGQAKVYPNPNLGRLTIELSSYQSGMPMEISITNLQGKPVYQQLIAELSSPVIKLDVQQLPRGYYLLHLKQGNWMSTSSICRR